MLINLAEPTILQADNDESPHKLVLSKAHGRMYVSIWNPSQMLLTAILAAPSPSMVTSSAV
jgi:hypothetical protein